MSYIKLFRLANGSVAQLTGTSVAIEKYLDEFLGITFLASEYSTGKVNRVSRKG